jgi:CRISPR-associated protein Cas2
VPWKEAKDYWEELRDGKYEWSSIGKRLREKGLVTRYGRWLQLSVFQCRLTTRRRAEMARRLEELIHARDDHVLILDLGPADRVDPRVESLGKTFESVKRSAIVI